MRKFYQARKKEVATLVERTHNIDHELLLRAVRKHTETKWVVLYIERRVPDVGGPEVFSVGNIASAWKLAHRLNKKVVHLPVPGAAAAFRRGQNTCPDDRYGEVTWEQYLSNGHLRRN